MSEPFYFDRRWSHALDAEAAGLAYAREKGWLLAWDQRRWLHVLSPTGQKQGQLHAEETIVQAAIADDGAAVLVALKNGEVCWLAPDLTLRWRRTLEAQPTAAAIDTLANVAAVSDVRGGVHFLDHSGKSIARFISPRPLQHLAFLATRALVVGSADFGLVGVFDAKGTWSWREGLVVNVGALSANGDGASILVACYSEGIMRYRLDGKNSMRLPTPEPCRLVSQIFDGAKMLAGGLGNQVYLLDRKGEVLARHACDQPIAALALSPLGDTAWVAQSTGEIVMFRIKKR